MIESDREEFVKEIVRQHAELDRLRKEIDLLSGANNRQGEIIAELRQADGKLRHEVCELKRKLEEEKAKTEAVAKQGQHWAETAKNGKAECHSLAEALFLAESERNALAYQLLKLMKERENDQKHSAV